MASFSAMSWPVIVPLLIFVVLYLLVFKTTQPGAYALDPQDAGSGANKGRGTFEPHNKNYLEFGKANNWPWLSLHRRYRGSFLSER